MSPLTESVNLVLAKDSVRAEPHYNSVSLLLHGYGSNNSTTISDSSLLKNTVTPADNAKIVTGVADPFGNSTRGVIALDGTGDWLNFPTISIAQGQDVTIECWVYKIAAPTSYLVLFSGGGGNVQIGDAFYINGFNAGGSTIGLGQWIHVAWVRSNNLWSRYYAGTRNITGTGNESFGIGRVGSISSGTGFELNGYLSDVRITVGIARYSGTTLTVPTAPFPEVTG